MFHKILSATEHTTPSPAGGFLQPGFVILNWWIELNQGISLPLTPSLVDSPLFQNSDRDRVNQGSTRRAGGENFANVGPQNLENVDL